MTLQSALLYVPDVAASVRFYEEALGLAVAFASEDGAYVQMESGGAALAFARESASAELGLPMRPARPGESAPAVQLSFETDDPEAVFARIEAAGGTVLNPPTARPWGQIVGHARDLNGLIIEIASPQAVDWHGKD